MTAVIVAENVNRSCLEGINAPIGKPVTGAWRLRPGQALGLRPLSPALLSVRQGRVWATLGIDGLRVPGEMGDHFLGVGERLRVPAGARLVMEVVARQGEAAQEACFDWQDAPTAGVPQARFEREVLVHWRALGRGLVQAALAAGFLLRGVLGYAAGCLAGRRQLDTVSGCRG